MGNKSVPTGLLLDINVISFWKKMSPADCYVIVFREAAQNIDDCWINV